MRFLIIRQALTESIFSWFLYYDIYSYIYTPLSFFFQYLLSVIPKCLTLNPFFRIPKNILKKQINKIKKKNA